MKKADVHCIKGLLFLILAGVLSLKELPVSFTISAFLSAVMGTGYMVGWLLDLGDDKTL